MPLPLRPNESVIYPQPFEEGKYNPLVITSERVFQFNQTGGMLHTENKTITGVGRGTNQSVFMTCAFLVLVGLPLFLYGALTWRSADKVKAKYDKGCPTLKTKSIAERKAIEECEAAGSASIRGIVFAGIGALFGVGAFFLFKKRFTVIIGAQNRVQTIKVKDKQEQTQIIMTVQAVVNTAKQMAASQAAAAAAAKGRGAR